MFGLFRAMTDRLKALFITDAALDFEAQLAVRAAERRAELIRQADRYDGEGLHTVAQQLREQVESFSLQRPLASILPATEHLLADPAAHTSVLLPFDANDGCPGKQAAKALAIAPRKKKGR